MLKLYTAPGACSTACHIVLQEAGIPFETKVVSFDEGYLDSKEFNRINPKGYIPFLEIDSGKSLTEGTAIMQYVADQAPEKNLMPTKGFERYKALEWLNYVATEMHRPMGGLFAAEHYIPNETARNEYITNVKKDLADKFTYVNTALEGKNFLMGTQYTIADAYMFVVCSWSKYLDIDLSAYKNLVGFQNRIYERPGTQRAFKTEGMLE